MVSTWRYYSFKGMSLSQAVHAADRDFARRRSFTASGIYAQPVLLAMSTAYVASGIAIRIGGIMRRRLRHAHPAPTPERQVG